VDVQNGFAEYNIDVDNLPDGGNVGLGCSPAGDNAKW
jgi:hypothetical protein